MLINSNGEITTLSINKLSEISRSLDDMLADGGGVGVNRTSIA